MDERDDEQLESLPIPRDPDAPTPLETVERYAKIARDDAFYDKLYKLGLMMAGDRITLDQVENFGTKSSEDIDLGNYPDIDPEIGPEGVQNHLLINSRINIQAVVYSSPQFVVKMENPLIREIVQSWLADVWDEIDFNAKSYEVGLDSEAYGMGFCEFGISDGGVSARPFSPLDCLFDRLTRSPRDWRYYFIRDRLDIEQAYERYGHVVSYEELEELQTEMQLSRNGGAHQENVKVIVEWRYWDRKTHCVFLGGIQDKPNRIILGFEEGKIDQYQRLEAPGPNPFGIIPVAVWVDSMAPGVKRPTSKTETTVRTSSLMNRIEAAIQWVIKKGAPRWILSALGLDPKTAEKLKEGGDLDDLGDIVVTDVENAKDALTITPAAPIPDSWLQARAILKDELNSATGVMDSMRGVTLPGERSATEVRINEANGGIQARHIQKQYQRFLTQSVKIMMRIGALYESKRRVLVLTDGMVDTANFAMRPFLSIEVPVGVQEDSLRYVTEEDRRQKRLLLFQTLELAAIQAGVGDPYKIFYEAYQDLGVRDPLERLYSREELAAKQMEQQMVAAAQAQGGQKENNQNGRDPNER